MKKILIVDDEVEIRELLASKLKKNDFEVLTAANGQQGLQLAKSACPDLLLLDVAMAGLDGFQTCSLLKKDEKTRHIPILFLTGKDLDPKSMSKRLEELGASGYIAKPSSFSELLEKIKELI